MLNTLVMKNYFKNLGELLIKKLNFIRGRVSVMKFLQWVLTIIGIDLLLLLLLKFFKEEVYYEKNEENINYDSDIEIRKMSYND